MMELGIGGDYPVTVDEKIKQIYEILEQIEEQMKFMGCELHEIMIHHAQHVIDEIEKEEIR